MGQSEESLEDLHTLWLFAREEFGNPELREPEPSIMGSEHNCSLLPGRHLNLPRLFALQTLKKRKSGTKAVNSLLERQAQTQKTQGQLSPNKSTLASTATTFHRVIIAVPLQKLI